jgi:hypothetical protein
MRTHVKVGESIPVYQHSLEYRLANYRFGIACFTRRRLQELCRCNGLSDNGKDGELIERLVVDTRKQLEELAVRYVLP